MASSDLKPFDRQVLSVVKQLAPNAYGVPIWGRLQEETGQNVSIGALYVALARLEELGYVTSRQGDPTPERGDRRKRFYEITDAGTRVLDDQQQTEAKLSTSSQPIPQMA